MFNTDYTILIVNKNRAMAQVLRFNFEIAGFTTVAARDTDEAIREMDSRQIDLVVISAPSPDEDGSDLCRHIREVLCDGDLPIVLCADKGMEEDLSHLAVCFGISKIYHKPANPKAIVGGVRELLYKNTNRRCRSMV